MFFYEWKKMTRTRALWVLLFVFIAANTGLCYFTVASEYGDSEKQYDAFIELYKENKEEIDAYRQDYMQKMREQIRREREAEERGEVLPEAATLPNRYAKDGKTDYELLFALEGRLNAQEAYIKNIQEILSSARNEIDRYNRMGIRQDDPIYLYQLAVIETYSKLTETEFVLEYPHGYLEFFSYRWMNPFLFAMVSLAVAVSFISEHRYGTASVLRCSYNGRSATAAAKLLAVCFFSALSVIAFTGSTILAVWAKVGLSSPGQSLSAIYPLCPFHLTVWQGIVINTAVKILVICAFAALVSCVAALFRNYIPVMIFGIFVYGASYLLTLVDPLEVNETLRAVNMISAIHAETLFGRLRVYTVLGNVLFFEKLIPIIWTALLVVAFALSVVLYSRGKTVGFSMIKKRTSKVKSFRPGPHACKPHSLIWYEFRKQVSVLSLIVLLAALVLTAYSMNKQFSSSRSVTDELYRTYVSKVAGSWTEEKSEYLRREYEGQYEITENYDETYGRYARGEISSDEFNAYYEDYLSAPLKITALNRILTQEKYIVEQNPSAHFLYELDWKALLLSDYSIFFALMMIWFSVMVFGREYAHGAFVLLRSVYRGRRDVLAAKYIAGILFSLAFALLFVAMQTGVAAVKTDLPSWDAPVASIEAFSGIPSYISLLDFMILRAATMLLSGMLMV